MTASAIAFSRSERVARISLDRAALHNAFDDALIAELCTAITAVSADPALSVLVLSGHGKSFSAGADLHWMRRMAAASEADNRSDSEQLAGLLRALAFCPQTTIARVNGAAFGGGVGLIAACDIAISVDSARFGLTETRLGLVPAVISPYVVDAIGARAARRYFQTGEQFDAATALGIGLIQDLVTADQLDPTIDRIIAQLLGNGPKALREAKQLALRIGGRSLAAQQTIDQDNAALIARLRVSREGQEGLSAFLDKRPPRFDGGDGGIGNGE
ncbi:MAG: enoyl-CoA hydratase-related protein [Lysobacterales bacterium]